KLDETRGVGPGKQGYRSGLVDAGDHSLGNRKPQRGVRNQPAADRGGFGTADIALANSTTLAAANEDGPVNVQGRGQAPRARRDGFLMNLLVWPALLVWPGLSTRS